MLIFLYGSDSYRLKRKLKEITAQYEKVRQGGLGFKLIELKTSGLDALEAELSSNTLFKEKKFIVLKDLFTLESKEVLPFLKKAKDSDDVILAYEEGEVKKSDAIFKFLKKEAKTQECSPLEGEKLKAWIKKEIASCGGDISSMALNSLSVFVGGDLWKMDNEIKKLVSYAKGRRIEQADVDLLVSARIESDIFKTIDAISQRNRKQALTLIHKHLEKGENPLYLFSMISFQFRNILSVKDFIEKSVPYFSILKKVKMHPFVVKKSYQQAGSFSFSELKDIYRMIFRADLAIKTGRIDAATALDLFVARV